mmetsp:Transcript_58930/g.161637  ORF Transcript_58930/g.161637 Transcript_58930/m.161637 type:complete len:267 (+) Transcript_58930:38-838(+)
MVKGCKIGVAPSTSRTTQRFVGDGRADHSTIRIHTGRLGFYQLKDDGARRFASTSQVISVLMRCVDGEASHELTAMARTHLLSLHVLNRLLQSRHLQEGHAARRLCMILGPELELAIAAAVHASLTPGSARQGAGQAALARARRASAAGDAAVERVRASALMQKRRSSSGGLVRRRSSARLLRRISSSTGRQRSGASLAKDPASAARVAVADELSQHFTDQAAVQRAYALLLRAARREEAAMIMQVAWRMHMHGPSRRFSEYCEAV